MDRVQTMKVFVGVAQHLGFAAAGRDLRMSPAAVTKHVNALESRIGTRLFDRTTRRVALTEAGRVYLEHCLECLQALEDADASVSELATEPRGLLRVTAPVDFAECLAPAVADVMNAHRQIAIDLRFSNRVVDMVEEGVDVAVRIASELDGRYVARPVAMSRLMITGSPEYLRRHGRPRRPADLASHRHVVFTEPRPLDELAFVRGRKKVRVKLNAVMATNSGAAILAAVREGVGLGMTPSFLGRADLEAGRIEPVLLDWSLRDLVVFAVYPHRRFLSPKVRVFVEALRSAFGDGATDPWWPTTLPRPATTESSPGRDEQRRRRVGRGRRSGHG